LTRTASRSRRTSTAIGSRRGGSARAAAPGAKVTFGGIDIWRVEDERITEYWMSSDGLHLMGQLGVGSH
jgi:hypothetical protein